jgi:outer membrane protein assembly factor BamD
LGALIRTMNRTVPLACLLLFACLQAACAGAQAQGAGPRSEAEQAYVDGMEHLSGGSTLEAEQDFQRVLKMPNYLELAPLARLRLADAQFHARRFDEAVLTYLAFIQRHDSNANVPYALFMVAKAHFEMAPVDLFFMPPIEELDLSAVQQARNHLERFIKQYPKSRYVTEATQLRDRCLALQWSHLRYVIQFYAGRGKWIGVAYRLHQAFQQFPVRAQTLEHYALLATAYDKLGWRARAVELWQAVGKRWPDTAEGRRAAGELARLQTAIAEAKARGDKDAEMPTEMPPTAAFKPEQQDVLLDEG